MCVVARSPVWSCRHHAFRQHPIASSSPIVAAIDARARRCATPTRATNFARIIHRLTRDIERSRWRIHRANASSSNGCANANERTTRPTTMRARRRRDRAYLVARARTCAIHTSRRRRRRSIDRSIVARVVVVVVVVVVQLCRRTTRRFDALNGPRGYSARATTTTTTTRDDDATTRGYFRDIYACIARTRTGVKYLASSSSSSSSSSSDARITSVRNAPPRRFIHWFARVARVGAPRVCASSARDGTGGA